MATIQKRQRGNGAVWYRARIRLREHPPAEASFKRWLEERAARRAEETL